MRKLRNEHRMPLLMVTNSTQHATAAAWTLDPILFLKYQVVVE